MAKLPLHPELMEIWEGLKQEVSDKYQAYEEWGARNREVMEQVPGLGPVLDFTAKLAEVPGAEVAFMAPAAIGDMASDILSATGKRANPKLLTEVVEHPTSVVKPQVWQPMEGPFPNATLGAWEHGPRIINPAAGEFAPGSLHYRPDVLRRELGMISGEDDVTEQWLRQMLQQGEEAPLRRHQFGATHEFGHEAAEELARQDFYKTFGLRGSADVSGEFLDAMARDLKHLRYLYELGESPPIPQFITAPGRLRYWTKGGDLNEFWSDAFALHGMGHKPGTVLKETVKDWSPIQQFFTNQPIRLKPLQDIIR